MDLLQKKHFMKRNPKTLNKTLQLRFLNRLSRLLGNGYTLLESLEVMKWDKQLAATASDIISLLKDGIPINHAFEKVAFSKTITSYLYLVSIDGDIQSSLEKCITMYKQQLDYTTKFQQTIRYPLFLLSTFILLMYFIKQSVLPSFVDLFETSASHSTTLTISLLLIDILTTGTFIGIGIVLLTLLVWLFVKQQLPIEKQITIYSRVPFYRNIKRIQTSFQFAIYFSSLLKTGMSIKEILQLIASQNKLPILAYYATLMTEELTKGIHLSSLIQQLPLLEKQLSSIIQKNVDAATLEKDLAIYADWLMEELHQKVSKTISLIQPIFFVILASFIIFIYISLMWPMFQLIQTI
ncbi:competence type IV pilus assembly protein ComGB [Oceanobacillus halotolerans]|uniref:competence type IV pilus assembly protein ComGB n=1 Tax=Oceanobacillus halotolerans TaxID=2663380 RepID=UPI0013DC5833|nr:competence type IV pilus assembly protein ComGB [Oceanobacillus halotolerans]